MAMRFDFFRFLLIELRQLIARLPFSAQKLIELRVDRLGVAMFGALNKERHHPRRNGGNRLPTERLRIEYNPRDDIGADNEEGQRSRRRHPDRRQDPLDTGWLRAEPSPAQSLRHC